MSRIGVHSVLVTLLFLMTIVHIEAKVSFWRDGVIMNCPMQSDSNSFTWYQRNKEWQKNGDATITYSYSNSVKDHFYCREHDAVEQYHFYFWGKGCENCFELDGMFVVVAIFVDLLVTAGVVMVACGLAQKKRAAGAAPSKPTPRTRGQNGPPVPSPDYEQLNPRTRSTDFYSSVNRMG